MNKMILILLILASLMLMGQGCISQTQITGASVMCNEPYIQKGTDCCLDANNNKICDEDEKTYTIEGESPTIEQTEPIIVGEKISIPVNRKTISVGEGSIFSLHILNVKNTIQTFYINIEQESAYNKNGALIVPTPSFDVIYRSTITVDPNKEEVIRVGIQVPSSIIAGTYIFHVYICDNIVGDSCNGIPMEELYDRIVHKIYVEVPNIEAARGRTSAAYWSTQDIAISAYGDSATTGLTLNIKNNKRDAVTVSAIKVSGVAMVGAGLPVTLGPGGTGTVNDPLIKCTAGQAFSDAIEITYTDSATGLSYILVGDTNLEGVCSN